MNDQMAPPFPTPITHFTIVLKSGERTSVKATKCVTSETTYDFIDHNGSVVKQFDKKDVASISSS